jgi:cellulose synthase operon protein C
MPPSTSKPLSPAELAKLEHAFASDPASDAYRPLAEAYLGMGRFMEAMVVCKKGVKAHPNVPHPRLLLSRVYAEQGKDKKALEEALAALQVAPADKIALRTTGALQLKTGEADAGKANLLKAFEADPGDNDTLEAMKTHRVEAPKKEPPPPPPPPPAPVVAAPGPTNGTAHAAAIQQAAAPAAPAGQAPRAAPAAAPAQARPAAAKQQGRPAAKPQTYDSTDSQEISALNPVPRRSSGGGGAKAVFQVLVILVPLTVAGYFGLGYYRAQRNREVNSMLTKIRDLVKRDSYASYLDASKLVENALDRDPGRDEAHGYGALIDAIRSGEHGGGEDSRKSAETHIKEVAKTTEPVTVVYNRVAAEALLKFHAGKKAEAAKELEDKAKSIDPEGSRAALLWLTLGQIKTDMGDLEGARESLERSQKILSTDARVYAALGNLNHRRGNDGEALRNFDTALKYERGHPDSMLGQAVLVLDQENPALAYGTAARNVKALVEANPPNSPRQEAMAQMLKSVLYSRFCGDLPLYKDVKFREELEKVTGITSAECGKAKETVKKAEEEAFSKDRSNPELVLLKGKKLIFDNQLANGIEELKKAIAADDTRAHYHVELGKALMRKEGGEKEAEEVLKRARAKVGESPKVLTMLGSAQYKQKKIDEAISTFEAAVKDNARNAEARYSLGRIYRDEKKDLNKSIENFERAAKDYVGNSMMVAQSYDEVAATQDAKGDKAKAREFYERANNADRDYDPAACHYARWLLKGGDGSKDKEKDKEKVRDLAKRYLDLNPRGECAAELKPFGA